MSKNIEQDVAAIKKCVCDDKLFRAEVHRYIGRVRESKLKVGELFHYYIEEHGNTYGDKICQRISEITGLSDNTVRSYHGYYRLMIEIQDNSNLSNLCDSAVCQLSRLLIMGDEAPEPILKLAKTAHEGGLSVGDIQKTVSGILDEHERIGGKKRRGGARSVPYSPAVMKSSAAKNTKSMKRLTIEAEHLTQLDAAIGVLELIADYRSEFGKGADIAETKRHLTRLFDLQLRCLRKMIESGEADDFRVLISRSINELLSLNDDAQKHSRSKKGAA